MENFQKRRLSFRNRQRKSCPFSCYPNCQKIQEQLFYQKRNTNDRLIVEDLLIKFCCQFVGSVNMQEKDQLNFLMEKEDKRNRLVTNLKEMNIYYLIPSQID